jgi:hypothetical protein
MSGSMSSSGMNKLPDLLKSAFTVFKARRHRLRDESRGTQWMLDDLGFSRIIGILFLGAAEPY